MADELVAYAALSGDPTLKAFWVKLTAVATVPLLKQILKLAVKHGLARLTMQARGNSSDMYASAQVAHAFYIALKKKPKNLTAFVASVEAKRAQAELASGGKPEEQEPPKEEVEVETVEPIKEVPADDAEDFGEWYKLIPAHWTVRHLSPMAVAGESPAVPLSSTFLATREGIAYKIWLSGKDRAFSAHYMAFADSQMSASAGKPYDGIFADPHNQGRFLVEGPHVPEAVLTDAGFVETLRQCRASGEFAHVNKLAQLADFKGYPSPLPSGAPAALTLKGGLYRLWAAGIKTFEAIRTLNEFVIAKGEQSRLKTQQQVPPPAPQGGSAKSAGATGRYSRELLLSRLRSVGLGDNAGAVRAQLVAGAGEAGTFGGGRTFIPTDPNRSELAMPRVKINMDTAREVAHFMGTGHLLSVADLKAIKHCRFKEYRMGLGALNPKEVPIEVETEFNLGEQFSFTARKSTSIPLATSEFQWVQAIKVFGKAIDVVHCNIEGLEFERDMFTHFVVPVQEAFVSAGTAFDVEIANWALAGFVARLQYAALVAEKGTFPRALECFGAVELVALSGKIAFGRRETFSSGRGSRARDGPAGGRPRPSDFLDDKYLKFKGVTVCPSHMLYKKCGDKCTYAKDKGHPSTTEAPEYFAQWKSAKAACSAKRRK